MTDGESTQDLKEAVQGFYKRPRNLEHIEKSVLLDFFKMLRCEPILRDDEEAFIAISPEEFERLIRDASR